MTLKQIMFPLRYHGETLEDYRKRQALQREIAKALPAQRNGILEYESWA